MSAPRVKRKPMRNRELARIHVLASQVGLDREQYEAVLWTVARVDSAAQLDEHGRRQVIAHLESRLPQNQAKAYPQRPHNADTEDRQELRKIEALLADAGLPWAYAGSMARRMYGKERLEFCAPHELAGILAALHNAAIKRLKSELEAELGEAWELRAEGIAGLLFGLADTQTLTSYPQTMSLVVRWMRGAIPAPACPWPVQPTYPSGTYCCSTCGLRSILMAG